VAVLGSIDDELLDELCAQHHPEMLYHTAAYKHVPLMESNPLAVVHNNALGTYRMAQAAVRNRIHHMLMVSTDKAVRPASIMGASKRMAELALLGCATASTRMTCVRLGNVLGSQGSVVGVFLEQIGRGDRVTVTHRDAERYFFTMEETVFLILEAASATQDKQILAPDMGRPTKILDLADQLGVMRPDLPLLIADRYEMLAPAAVALALRIPIAHIEGGEISQGAIDDAVRNALTKMAHIHFTSTEAERQRVIAMGEEPWRVHWAGAPSLDHLRRATLLRRDEVDDVCNLT
jgi:nucleoside-diphosphate-sugar epimerase